MDRDAKERIQRDIDPKRGILNELESVLEDNYDKSDYRPSTRQQEAMRDFYTDKRKEKVRATNVKAFGRDYIKTNDGDFKKAEKKDRATYITKNDGQVYVKDNTGDWRVIDK